jgi:hypothetical protein
MALKVYKTRGEICRERLEGTRSIHGEKPVPRGWYVRVYRRQYKVAYRFGDIRSPQWSGNPVKGSQPFILSEWEG